MYRATYNHLFCCCRKSSSTLHGIPEEAQPTVKVKNSHCASPSGGEASKLYGILVSAFKIIVTISNSVL